MRTRREEGGWKAALMGAAVFVLGSTTPLAGQSVNDWKAFLAAAAAMGPRPGTNPTRAAYSGVIDWTNTSTDRDGTATETAQVAIVAGQVTCIVVYTSPGHSATAVGPGLLEIDVGLPPEKPSKGQAYEIRVACPDPEYTDRIRDARWSHMMNTYRQPGGDLKFDPGTKRQILPATLEGGWTEQYDGPSSTKLSWKLCRGCPPPRLPPTPPPPPQP